MNIGLLLIDPQNDFHDIPESNRPKGVESALAVPGACDDAERLIQFLDRNAHAIQDVYVTLDTHKEYDIGHALFWVDKEGQPPAPFTQITSADIEAGRFKPTDEALTDYTLAYARALESAGRFKITIWPTHCLDGSWGWEVYKPVLEALDRWSSATGAAPAYKRKGTHYLTEHYAAFAAEYPIENAPETQVDTALLDRLAQHDLILVSGQALSHCVGETLRQMTDLWPRKLCEKVILLQDTTSPVPGFEAHAEALVKQIQSAGIKIVAKSTISGTSDLLL
jgi:nicotinamidase-related amidase